MVGADTIDWSATGAMIGGFGAWAQLLAAAAGVVVAYRIGRAQVTAVEQAEEGRRRKVVASLRALCADAMLSIEAQASFILEGEPPAEINYGAMDAVVALFGDVANAIDGYDARVLSPAGVVAVIHITRACRDFRQIVDEVATDWEALLGLPDERRSRVQTWLEDAREAAAAISNER